MAKARKKIQRTIRLIRSPSADGVGLFRIAAGRKSDWYTFHEIPCEIGGRGFAVHRLGLGTLYHVRVGVPEDCSCECLGFLRHGKCKHVLGLLALIRRKEI
ncbi:MAG: SWIM zinc finger domain-containing protein [Planctomycetes bacterium]|nr:SWIM zinc finger domain-containing protein [Planctomycetota bacterium]